MAIGRGGGVARQFRAIFEAGTVAGLSDAQLLERFATRREPSAFEAIVARHGPLVLGVCRNVLRDAHAAEDAFQATFLVLARRAGAIQKRDSLGPWLHGVAYRVSAGARADIARRRSIERGPTDPAVDPLAEGVDAESRAAIHEEVQRLPEKYRAPVVLCYFEGLTHDEAAGRLGWPLGTVRGRLARARDLLRGRLARRGLAPAAALLSTGLVRESAAALSETLQILTVRAALRVAAGEAITAGACSATVAALTEGVLRTMMMTKMKMTAAALLIAGFAATGAGVAARQDGDKSEGAAGVAKGEAKPKAAAPAEPERESDKADRKSAPRPDVDERIAKMEMTLQKLMEQSVEMRGALQKLDEKPPGKTGNPLLDANLDQLLPELQAECGMLWAVLPEARGNTETMNKLRGDAAEILAALPALKGRAGKLRSDLEQIEETRAMLEQVRKALFSLDPRTEDALRSESVGDEPDSITVTRPVRRYRNIGQGRRAPDRSRNPAASDPATGPPADEAPPAGGQADDARLRRLERLVEMLLEENRRAVKVQPEE